MPGLVGLAIVDSFAAEAPIITTSVPYHSPEIEYLEDGVNGILVRDEYSPDQFAQAVLEVLTDESLGTRLRSGCRIAAERYTNEEMVHRFANGIERALETTGVNVRHKFSWPRIWRREIAKDRVAGPRFLSHLARRRLVVEEVSLEIKG
jgi:hypothetical protein